MRERSDIILLDGAMGQELLRRSPVADPKYWSAQYLFEAPDLVRQIHLEYIEAGARVITINAYSASFNRMAMVNASERVPQMQRVACQLALEARERAGSAGSEVAIAGCLPPLNGSYRPDRVRAFDTNLAEYRRLVELQAPHVDLFICETMSTAAEACAAASAACETGLPTWVSWSLREADPVALHSGQSIEQAFAAIDSLGVDSVLVNCVSPERVTAAVEKLAATGCRFGVYANGFTHIPTTYVPGKTAKTLQARTDLGPGRYADFALSWATCGASVVGGCCEVGPAHISRLRDALSAAGYRICGPFSAPESAKAGRGER